MGLEFTRLKIPGEENSRVNSATSNYHRLPSDTTDPNYALFKEMSDEISKDPNFDRERWVAKNGSRIYAAKNTRRRE